MVLQRLLAPRPALAAGRALYAASASQARQPAFYRSMGAPDTVEGRFGLYSLHVGLVVLRLKGEGEPAAETAQHLFDAYVRSLDDALRELGVSDITVGRKMRRLGEAFYGRLRSLDEALQQLPRSAPLEDVLSRTVLEAADASPAPLAAYVTRAAETLRAQPLADLLQGRIAWPEPQP